MKKRVIHTLMVLVSCAPAIAQESGDADAAALAKKAPNSRFLSTFCPLLGIS